MKYSLLLLVFVPFFLSAQEAKLHIEIKNATAEELYIYKDVFVDADLLFGSKGMTFMIKDGELRHDFDLNKPTFIRIIYREATSNTRLSYHLFISPGDDLQLTIDASDPAAPYLIKGKGSENNQLPIQAIIDEDHGLKAYQRDSLPFEVFEAIKFAGKQKQKALAAYIESFQPSASFIKTFKLLADSYVTRTYLKFQGKQRYTARDFYQRNQAQWLNISDSLTTNLDLNNAALLDIPSHLYFLYSYTLRIKERAQENPKLLAIYDADESTSSNVLIGKVIDQHFSGRTAEFVYASLFKQNIGDDDLDLPVVFDRFKAKYPNSSYLSKIEPSITQIKAQIQGTMTDEMSLVEDTEKLQTMEDVLQIVKGKTVLLDMWGTWCGPCRSEFSKHAEALKAHFEAKGVDFLYIANYDLKNIDKWKKLIAYYNLKGTHILASQALTNDIMKKVGGTGYPTYVIIKKDGSYARPSTAYPIKREALIEDLEQALKQE